MKRWRFHSYRDSFAFNFLKRGGAMYSLQAILGHKTIQLTVDVDLYGHFSAERVRNVSPYDYSSIFEEAQMGFLFLTTRPLPE